jgi:hypothetical protein
VDTRDERIAAAKLAGVAARLRDHMPAAAADALLADFIDQAAAVGVTPLHEAFWSELEPWLARNAAVRRNPGPGDPSGS